MADGEKSRDQLVQELAAVRQRLVELEEVQAGCRRREEVLAAALRREESRDRIRAQILQMRHLSEFPRGLERAWIAELRGLGVPVHAISVQLPASGAECCSLRPVFLEAGAPARVPLATCPWVEEAWESGRPVVVDRRRLEEVGFDPQVQSLLEVPFAEGGSLEVNTLVTDAFDPETIGVVQGFAGLIAEGLQRLRELEALHQAEQNSRINLALQRVRNEILLMAGEEDWKKVISCLHVELLLLMDFYSCSINLVDRAEHRVVCYDLIPGREVRQWTEPGIAPALLRALETGQPVYRPNRNDPLFEKGILYTINSVVDVPFSGGTMAIDHTQEDAFDQQEIWVLEQFAQVLSEAYRRLEDLKTLALREQQLRQVQKLEAIGQLAAGVAHEINNPLTAVVGYSELLMQRPLDQEARRSLEAIHQGGMRARDIIVRLLNFAQQQRRGRQKADLNVLVRETLDLVRQQFSLAGLELVEDLQPGLLLGEVDPGQVQQVVLQLLHNSRDALLEAGEGGQVRVRTRRRDAWVRLEVEDDGPGIAAAVRERVFDPPSSRPRSRAKGWAWD